MKKFTILLKFGPVDVRRPFVFLAVFVQDVDSGNVRAENRAKIGWTRWMDMR